MDIEWTKLRAFNGDIKNGFEELVCQLARVEQISNKTKFFRVAAPDGGVEAYCVLSDNSEYGWQAKFFSTIGDVQWSQLDESFKTAFVKHPNLIKYYICVPLDRPDPRITIAKGKRKGQTVNHLMDKWNTKVAEWEGFAKSNNRTVEFEFWGNSEIFERLSKKENEGKLYYWFGNEEFSDEWFNQKLEENIKNLDKRYTPELNFELPIAKIFDGISRDKYFNEQFNSYLDDLLKHYRKAVNHINEVKVKGHIDKIASTISAFRQQCEQINYVEISTIDNAGLTSLLENVKENSDNLIQKLYEIDSALKKVKKEKRYENDTNKFSWDIELFRKLNSSIYEFSEFLNGTTVRLSNNPFLLLIGEAGIGKSHLLADVAVKRADRKQFSILLLGQHFTEEEPWNQIKKQLQLNCERDTFLASLNAKAEATESRVLILIDAINEGKGKELWKNYIAGFIAAVKKFPNIGVVFSLRISYEKLLIPSSLKEKNEIVKVVHYGFSHHEYEASKRFFDNFGIKQPSIPLLHPEFSNPLFLKLFCEGLSKKGLHEIPDGYEGISTVLNFYLEAINNRVSEKHKLPENLNLTQKVIKKIASQIADTENTYIKFDDAYATITLFAKDNSITEPAEFFQDLIREGLLTQNLYWEKGGNSFDGVYISYERFSDHLVCSYFLQNYFDRSNPTDTFAKGNKLHKLLENERTAYYNKGIIEALSIQLPELAGIELFEAAPHAKEFYIVVEAFIESIIWRKKETINEKLKDYINDVVINIHDLHDYFLNTILLITSQPKHYFNSDFLHHHLMKFSMADRDSWWIPFIHHQYPTYPDEITSIKRMIDWSWTDDKRENISDESIRLMCQTLFWFTSSSNRALRDAATKAIICLLEERTNVLIQLIKTFEKVNDPYVLQRLYAITLGCAVRTNQVSSLKELGDCVFEVVFDTEYVIPDILLRDYARGIIDYAVFKGHKFDFDLNKTKPPFKSDLPTSFPTKKDIDKYEYDYKAEDFKDYYWSLNSIISSMKTNTGGQMYGDFGRYTFESAFDSWRVNAQLLSNLAVKWIIEKYGYDVEKHGQFDRSIHSDGRHSHKTERIGKKYQWIAFYELLARVSDNLPFYADSYSPNAKPILYKGPWEPYIRDIDPTITIKENPEERDEKFWWNPVDYNNWNFPNKEWISKTDDVPNPLEMISVFDNNGAEWLVLEIQKSWTEPADVGEDKNENPHKDLWYQIRSYITKKKHHTKIIKCSKEKNFMGRWMPESANRYQMFSREYYWSAANETFSDPYYRGESWSEIYDNKTHQLVGKVAVTAVDYLWEEEYDASKESTISFYKPTEVLFNLLDLQYSKVEGHLLTRDGQMICFDPCATQPTHSCLVVKKDELIKKLEENNLNIFWTVLGEKLVIGGDHRMRDEWMGRLNISGVVYYERNKLKHVPYFVEEK
ncbi:MAG: hypothetical protein RSF68_00780 [Myroides sp.]